jgi:uncharacterized membrane protein
MSLPFIGARAPAINSISFNYHIAEKFWENSSYKELRDLEF